MKTLEEKKLLVKMAKMLGQPVDSALVESIEKEEKLAKLLFKEETKEEIIGYEKGTTFLNRKPIVAEEPAPILTEEPVIITEVDIDRGGVSPPVPPKEVVPPTVDYITKPTQGELVKQTMKALNTAAPKIVSTLERKEIEGIKRTLSEMMQKIGTLTWGGGGTGIVKIWDADDLDRANAADGLFVQYNEARKQFTFAAGAGGGAQGAQGRQGVQGAQGIQGAVGAQGAQGIQGAIGAQGIQGSQGYQGLAGVQGEQGAVGAQGVQGEQGNQGYQGVQGSPGTGFVNTLLITNSAYTVQTTDYYIGVDSATAVTITLPDPSTNGRIVIIKDESGNCSNNNITLSGPIDNDNTAIMAIDNMTLQLLYRSGWRII